MCVNRPRAWKMLHLTIKLVWNQDELKLNNTSRGVRLAFHEQGPFRELEFYQCVTKCCTGYNHTPKFFLSLFWSLPTNLTQQFVLLRQVFKLQCFPHTKATCRSKLIHSPHRLLTRTWSSYRLSSFPLKIAHLWRASNLPSKNCAILSDSLLGSRIAQSCQPTLLVGSVQIFLATSYSA